MRQDKQDDLDWLAFCYIADELSPADEEAFERRLADDQRAREAVARAVDLTMAVAAAGAAPSPRTTPASGAIGIWRRASLASRLAWTAIAASACLAAVVAFVHHVSTGPVAGPPREAPTQEKAAVPNAGDGRLALLWSRTAEELAALQLDDDWGDDSAADGSGEDDGWSETPWPPSDVPPDPYEDAFASNAPPSWLLAAVQAVAGGSETEDDGDSSLGEN